MRTCCTYKGDSVWTYELGTKYSSNDRRVSLAAAVFYNDYKNYIGLNSIAPSITGSFTTIDLNTRRRRRATESNLRASSARCPQWTLSGAVSLQHARLTNFDDYFCLNRPGSRVEPPDVPA